MNLPGIAMGFGFRGMDPIHAQHGIARGPTGPVLHYGMQKGQSLYGRAVGASQIAPKVNFQEGVFKTGTVALPKKKQQGQQQQRKPGGPPYTPDMNAGWNAMQTERPPYKEPPLGIPERTGIRPWSDVGELGAAPEARAHGPGPMTPIGPATYGPAATRIAGEIGPAPTARPHGGPEPAGELGRAWDIPQPPAGGWARPELTQGEPARPMGGPQMGQQEMPSAVLGEQEPVGQPMPSTRARRSRRNAFAPNQGSLELEE
jgi:hypothetical protein